MQLYILRSAGRKLYKLLPAADDVYLAAILAYPYGQWRSPIALTAEAPVYNVFKEVAHAPLLYGLRQPVYAPVVLY